MIELIIGVLIGAVISVTIAQIYHSRASAGLREEIDRLEKSNEAMRQSIEDLDDVASKISQDTDVTRRHTVVGTPDDPDYPYK